jgi:hypothetical protein
MAVSGSVDDLNPVRRQIKRAKELNALNAQIQAHPKEGVAREVKRLCANLFTFWNSVQIDKHATDLRRGQLQVAQLIK